MAYIYIGQYQGKSLLSWYIKRVTGSKISHTGAFLPPDENGNWSTVVEAWRKGVVERPWTEGHEPGTIIDIYRIECTEDQARVFYDGVRSCIGDKYDLPGLIWFKVHLNMQREDCWFCSELIVFWLFVAGIKILERIEHWKVDPGRVDISPVLEHVVQLKTP